MSELVDNLKESRDEDFWRSHNGVMLVWSNSKASDSVMIANALLRPGFHLLLDIAVRFGLERLISEWDTLRDGILASEYPEELHRLHRAEPTVLRCLACFEEAAR